MIRSHTGLLSHYYTRHERITCLVICMLTCAFPTFSQQKTYDSLKSLIKKNAGIDKYEPLISLVREYCAVDSNQKALTLVKEARQLAYHSGDSSKIVQSSRILGQVYNRLSMPNEAEIILLEALPMAKRHNLKGDYKTILSNLAIASAFQAKYDKALALNLQVLELRKEDKDDPGTCVSLQVLGVIHYKLKSYEKALSYFTKSLELKKKIKEDYGTEQILINISLCHANMNRFTTAKTFVDSALAFCNDKQCNEFIFMNTNFSLGVIHYGLLEFNSAERYFLKSYDLAKKLKNDRFIFDNIDHLSEIYLKDNRLADAVHYLNEAEELMSNSDQLNLELIKIYARLYQLHKKLRNFEKVAFYQEKYIELKDSTYNEELTTNLMKIEADYIDRESKARIAAQEQILNLNKEIIERQRWLNVFIGCTAIMFLGFIFLLIKSNREKQKLNTKLDHRVKERTLQLEDNNQALLHASQERETLINHTSSEMKSLLATIKGLCAISLLDISDPKARQYMTRIDHTSNDLTLVLKNLEASVFQRQL
jgi:tetratricopeptide (TPR) repeat protein